MNSKDIRKYWIDKYTQKTKKKYNTEKDKYVVELTFLKKLLLKYNEFVVLEAIDEFFAIGKNFPTILNFTNPKYFEERFHKIIVLKPILEYKRMIDTNPEIKDLVKEYLDYHDSYIIFDHEKVRKIEILKEIKDKLEGKNAAGIGR